MHTMIRQALTTIPNIGNQGGKSPVQDMLRGVKTHAVYMRLAGTIVVAVGGAGNVRDESYQNLITIFRILEGGNPIVDLTGPALSYFTKKYGQQLTSNISGTGLPATGAALAAGTYTVEIDFRVNFVKGPGFAAGDPAETVLIDSQTGVKTQLEVTWPSNAANVIGTANPTNVSMTGLVLYPVQKYDSAAGDPPYFLTRIYRGPSSGNIAGTQTDFPTLFYPQGSNRIESVMFRSVVDGFTSDGVLNGLVTLRGDRVKYWDRIQYQEVQDEIARRFTTANIRNGYLDFDLRENGKLSENYIGGQDQNPRLLADVTNPGAVASFEWYTSELESIDGVTKSLVQQVVGPDGKPKNVTLPF